MKIWNRFLISLIGIIFISTSLLGMELVEKEKQVLSDNQLFYLVANDTWRHHILPLLIYGSKGFQDVLQDVSFLSRVNKRCRGLVYEDGKLKKDILQQLVDFGMRNKGSVLNWAFFMLPRIKFKAKIAYNNLRTLLENVNTQIVNLKSITDSKGKTVYYKAGEEKNAELLALLNDIEMVSEGKISSSNSSQLVEAAYRGDFEKVSELVISANDEELELVIHDAIVNGQFHIIKYLTEQGMIRNIDEALKDAVGGGKYEIFEYLMEKNGNDEGKALGDGMTLAAALMGAARNGDLEVMKHFIEKDERNNGDQLRIYGMGMLKYAAQYGHCDVIDYIIQKKPNGIDETFNGKSALLVACKAGHPKAVKCLIQGGSDVNRVLRQAIANGNSGVIKLLCKQHNVNVSTASILYGISLGCLCILGDCLNHCRDERIRSPKSLVPDDYSTNLKEITDKYWKAFSKASSCVIV